MGFSRKRVRYVSWKEMNDHLEYCEMYRKIVNGPKPAGETFGMRAYAEDKEVRFELSYKRGTQACTYICRKDGEDATQFTDGGEAYRILSKYYRVPDFREDEAICDQLGWIEDEGKFFASAKPLLYKSEKHDGTRNRAIGYDLNSSYSYAMLKNMPDTSAKPVAGYVKNGQIGFVDDGGTLRPIFQGFSLWVFPLMESPFKRFVDHWYAEKKAGNPKAKGILNYSIGYLQRVNPFLRATIIHYANEEIAKLIDGDTLYCNTDSLVSLKPRDLRVGKEIGDFKVEHEGLFAYRGFNYQWGYDVPSYRGVSKSWFPEGWDILRDRLPSNGNIVEYRDYRLRER